MAVAHSFKKTSVFRREGVIPSIFCAKSDNGRITPHCIIIMVLSFPYKKSLLLDQFPPPLSMVLPMGNLWIGCDGCNQCFNLKSN